MNRIIHNLIFLFIFGFAFSQQNKKDENLDLKIWYHKDFSTTGIYGINTENAYKFLESKGLKPHEVIVGVLDSGVEIDHPGLMENIWINTKEIPNNGIDDDENGYIDDIHGWNFQGGKDSDVDIDNMEVTRIVKKYKLVFEGANSIKNKENKENMPKEYEMYNKAKEIFLSKNLIAYRTLKEYLEIKKNIPEILELLDGNALTKENLEEIVPKNPIERMNIYMLSKMLSDNSVAGKSGKNLFDAFSEIVDDVIKTFSSQIEKQYNTQYDPRDIVGDNYENLDERYYGNNHYEGPDAMHGTHVAGIIAGIPTDEEVQFGIASKVAKIMSVRAVPDGDERDKDVANAILYAVDNGAKVLNMSFGKPISPNKEKVWEAIKYAEKKGVLIVKAAGNDNEDLSEHIYYPTNFINPEDEKASFNNVIVVGASTNDSENLKAPFSNYSQKMVDVFAPGDKVYSTVTDKGYKYLRGTSMASPMVAGAAAVLLAYMPSITPDQIIESIVKTANKSTTNANIERSINNTFNYMSRSGGVMDMYKAAQYAYDKFYNEKSTIKKNKRKKMKHKVYESM